MTRQRRLEALYTAQRAAEVTRQLKQYINECERTKTVTERAPDSNNNERAAEGA
jgi:hypothetical protein